MSQSDRPDHDARTAELLSEAVDATRRTHLANERTQLAWWRTGLTALALAIGIGRVVPELDSSATQWPYIVTGVGIALWGVLAIAYGSSRRSAVDRALEQGRFHHAQEWQLRALAGGAIVLGLLTAAMILVG